MNKDKKTNAMISAITAAAAAATAATAAAGQDKIKFTREGGKITSIRCRGTPVEPAPGREKDFSDTCRLLEECLEAESLIQYDTGDLESNRAKDGFLLRGTLSRPLSQILSQTPPAGRPSAVFVYTVEPTRLNSPLKTIDNIIYEIEKKLIIPPMYFKHCRSDKTSTLEVITLGLSSPRLL